ncbi:MAG: hypothetical protein K2K73_00480 [Ureaplasma sp.]|nr:hypothetical protein [Ureaplasma sp.]
MHAQVTRLKHIRGTGFILLAFVFTCILTFILKLFIPDLFGTEEEARIFSFALVVVLIICGIINFICSIVILATKWRNKWVRDHKVIWGLLSLFLLTCLGLIIFCSIAITHVEDQYDDANNYYNNQMPHHDQYRNYPYPPMPPRPYEDTYNSPYSNNSRKKRDKYDDRFNDRFDDWY